MNHTTNYQLNQWELHDRVMMQDFNADNAKIDAALKAEADARAAVDAAEASARQAADTAEATAREAADTAQQATLNSHAAQLAKLGNCQIYTTTYVGNGTNTENFGESHPNSLTFPWKPAWVVILSPDGGLQLNIFPGDSTHTISNTGPQPLKMNVKWNGSTVTWYTDSAILQMNWINEVYHVFAFRSMS